MQYPVDATLLATLTDRYRGDMLERLVVNNTFYGAEIKVADFILLNSLKWLNDALMTFWITWWCKRIGAACIDHSVVPTGVGNRPRCYCHSTYFYTSLYSLEKKYHYESVKGQTPDYLDIFEDLDLLFVPVNIARSHWYLAVIDFETKETRVYDSMYENHQEVHTHLLRWLGDVSSEQRGTFKRTEWRAGASPIRPRQDNGSDCGVFTCMYMACLSLGVTDFDFRQQNILQFRHWMAQLIYRIGQRPLEHASTKRSIASATKGGSGRSGSSSSSTTKLVAGGLCLARVSPDDHTADPPPVPEQRPRRRFPTRRQNTEGRGHSDGGTVLGSDDDDEEHATSKVGVNELKRDKAQRDDGAGHISLSDSDDE